MLKESLEFAGETATVRLPGSVQPGRELGYTVVAKLFNPENPEIDELARMLSLPDFTAARAGVLVSQGLLGQLCWRVMVAPLRLSLCLLAD